MNFRKEIKKVVCSMLILLVSFILVMEDKVYSSGIDDPIILQPTNNQYIELKAVRAFEFSKEDFQITMQVWVHGLETTGFTVRLNYDNSILQPSSFEDNTITTDSTKFFRFSNGLEVNMDMLSINEDESTMLLLAAVKDYEETENPYIVEKEGIGKVLDGTGTDRSNGRRN